MKKLRVLIVDDEEVARRRLVRLISLMEQIEVVAECENAESALAFIREGAVDVLLLDIHMPGLTGVELMSLLPNPSPYVIFCTAHSEHAVDAFDLGAVDYVLKPIDAARLQKALDRAREKLKPKLGKLAIKTNKGIELIDPKDVSHAEVEGELVSVFTENGRLLTDFSLQQLAEKLPSETFERVHRRALLNWDHVVRVEPNEVGGLTAITKAGHRVEVSRASARKWRQGIE